MANELFSFEDLSQKDKAVKTLQRQFQRAGVTVASVDINPSVKRTAGISYREITMAFADSQTVTFRIKKTGDIYQVLLNKKVIPIKNQDNQNKAIKEVTEKLESGRAAFQKKLARVKAPLPPGVKSTAPKLEEAQAQKITGLTETIGELQKQVTNVRSETAQINAQIAALEAA